MPERKINKLKIKTAFIFTLMVNTGMIGFVGTMLAYEVGSIDKAYFINGPIFLTYLFFYWVMFGLDSWRVFVMNLLLGAYGAHMDLVKIFEKFDINTIDYSLALNVIPIIYYIMVVFLFWKFLVRIVGAENNENREKILIFFYVAISVGVRITIARF